MHGSISSTRKHFGGVALGSGAVVRGWIGRLALIVLGAVFLAAGGLKALDPAGFTDQIREYKVLPWAAPWVAALLIPAEVALGVGLILDFRRRLLLPVALVFLAGFIGLLGYTWATGGDVSSCGCFGNFVQRTPAETLLEDLGFIGIALLGFLAPIRSNGGGALRGSIVAASAAAALAMVFAAPSLPLDGVVTALKPGVKLEDLKLSLPDTSLLRGRHLVALLDLKSEASGKAADALTVLASKAGAPPVAVIHADEDEVKDEFFWAHGPSYPMYRVVHGEFRRLYRTLPRFFLLQDGEVVAVWNSLPSADTIVASRGSDPQETIR